MQLTEHFRLSEFTKSQTATRYGIDNTPTPEVIANLKRLCQEVLEPLRKAMNEPVTVTSGYRCPALNSHPAIKGKPNSQHLLGEAADIHLPTPQHASKYAQFIMEHCQFDQMLIETNKQGNKWLHVSCKQKGNRQTFNAHYRG